AIKLETGSNVSSPSSIRQLMRWLTSAWTNANSLTIDVYSAETRNQAATDYFLPPTTYSPPPTTYSPSLAARRLQQLGVALAALACQATGLVGRESRPPRRGS